jgi:3'(2'), 5'-bisphosphate nucleotidase
MDDAALAAEVASEAGYLLLEVRNSLRDWEPAQRGAEADRRSHEFITSRLRDEGPGDAVLSEESVEDPRRFFAQRVWIVDPLDGTREFSEPERSDWAVQVAIWECGRVIAGAVALPALDVTLSTRDVQLAVPKSRPPRIVVSRTRAPQIAGAAARLHASRLDGSPLVYNQLDPSLPDLLVSRHELAPAVLAAVKQ